MTGGLVVEHVQPPGPEAVALVPTNTTSAAAYVAVAVMVSLLSVSKTRLTTSANKMTATEVVIKLFVRD
jgi:hypothetical protein